jgi:hypothetical protein
MGLVTLCCGCSLIFMERLPNTHRPGDPAHCTATKGFVAWDGVLIAADAISAIGTFVVATNAESEEVFDSTPYLVIGAMAGLSAIIHTISAAQGNSWADDCRQARADHDQANRQRVVVQKPLPAKPAQPTRKVVEGDKPVFCSISAPDVGICSLDEAYCNSEAERTGTPKCEQRNAASCFNATKTLDGSKLTFCAASIKDCEARRQNYAADPDYTVTGCGIYRLKQ